MKRKSLLGSKTAKGGFNNEKEICRKFNNWKKDAEAKSWLTIMGYDVKKIKNVNAIQIPTVLKKTELSKYNITEKDYNEFAKYKKADAQIKITIIVGSIIKIENLSLKKANSDADFNQLDKRAIDSYQEMWKFNDEIALWLKLFTGEKKPSNNKKLIKGKKLRDERRLFIDEMPKTIQDKILRFFNNNKILILCDVMKGRGGLSADWLLVTKYEKDKNETLWVLKEINSVINFFGKGRVEISPRGSIYIGKITIQRKGGTPDPTKLQFKFKPCELFKLVD